MIDLATAVVYNSPADIASWPETGTITKLSMDATNGLSFEFSTSETWPNEASTSFGPLQYTVWPVLFINNQWVTSGIIQMWKDRPSTGAPFISQFYNWAYDQRWGPMNGYKPSAGEKVGFFLSAGNARGVTDVNTVRERTNVVEVALPAGDNGVFGFAPPAVAPPVVVPAPPIVAVPDVSAQLAAIKLQLDALSLKPYPNYSTVLFGTTVVFKPVA